MRIITEKQIGEFARKNAEARNALLRWTEMTKEAEWKSLAQIRLTFRSADEVVVASGRPVVIFNIKGNGYRLITAVHYNKARVYVMAFLTHADYDKEAWKRNL